MSYLIDVAKNLVVSTRPGRRLLDLRRRRRGYVAETNTPGYVRTAFHGHYDRLAKHHPLSGTLLEIGPGSNLGVAALFVRSGIDSAVCMDMERWLEPQDELYEELGVADLLDRVEYRYPAAIEAAPFPDESFDVIFSTAAFEHFADPGIAIREIARLLKPGGITSHQIDLRDHRNFDRPLDFLRLSDREWGRATSRRPAEPNRWRATELLDAFRDAGLRVVEDIRTTVPLTEDEIARFDARFRARARDDLETISLFVVATKPG